ncbi:hypothetical protein OHS71_35560 [Streptomyces sp. NBC_00377]|uniref:hypothetical protein n=1 Tax=unclassified Streptomyces TaxID=2593676 RepID=UPI002E1B4020|nr:MULTISPECIES: hypothetical protein [unclassified Streptomyces]
MTKYARFVSLVFAGLFAGLLTSDLVPELSLRGFDSTVYTQVRLVELDALDKLAVATLLPALIATAVPDPEQHIIVWTAAPGSVTLARSASAPLSCF